MEKRFYLNITNGTLNHCVVPVEVVSENKSALRVRLLEDYISREQITQIELEVIARKGDEFEMSNRTKHGTLKEALELLGGEYSISVLLVDSN